MSVITSRQISFVQLLLLESEYRPIKCFTAQLKVSDKTLQKDLKIIEKYVKKFEITIDTKPGSGIRLNKSLNNKRLLLNDLQFQEDANRKISITERRFEIIKMLLDTSNMVTSIQKLSEKYYISKTSIVNDMKYIEDWISMFDLVLCKTVSGTKIIGKEVNIRRAIASLIQYYYNDEENESKIQKLSFRVDRTTLKGLQELFENDRILYVSSLIEELEKKYFYQLDDPYYINLLTHILISLKRGSEGKKVEDFIIGNTEVIKLDKSYSMAKWLVDKINNRYNIELPESEVYYVFQYFITSGFQNSLAEIERTDIDVFNRNVSNITKEMITNVCIIIQKDLPIDEVLMEGLILHIRPMLNRLGYNIQIHNPLLPEIVEQYNETFNICKAAMLLLAYEYDMKAISVDEIGYLTMYFQAAMERTVLKTKIIVVCQSGYGTSQLLMTKLKEAFPQWEIVDVLSVNKLEKRNLDDIDFIISTVHLDLNNCKKPFILVSAFLNANDIENISNVVKKDIFVKRNYDIKFNFINELLQQENIYFNQSMTEFSSILSARYGNKYKFEKLCFGDNVKVYLTFKHDERNIILSLNNKEEKKREIIFYLVMDDKNIALNILSEIYSLYKNQRKIYSLIKCNKVQDVKNCLALNKGAGKGKTIDLSGVISSETIKFEMYATTKEEAIRELTQVLFNAGKIIDMDAFIEDVYYREKLGVTGLGNGIAIPHGKSRFVYGTSVAIGRTKQPIAWESLDNQPVNFIILFAVNSEDKNSTDVRLISHIATKLGDDGICEQLKGALTSKEIYDIFAGSDKRK